MLGTTDMPAKRLVHSYESRCLVTNKNNNLITNKSWEIITDTITNGGSEFALLFSNDLTCVNFKISGEDVPLKLVSDITADELVYEGVLEESDWGNICNCDWDIELTVKVINDNKIQGNFSIGTSDTYCTNGDSVSYIGKSSSIKSRGPSPYIIFCSEKRAELKKTHPDATFGEIGMILGQMWTALDERSKLVCYQIYLFFLFNHSIPFLIFFKGLHQKIC